MAIAARAILRIARRQVCQTDARVAKGPRRDVQPVIGAYDALALIPTD
jgi:hypothetical protein